MFFLWNIVLAFVKFDKSKLFIKSTYDEGVILMFLLFFCYITQAALRHMVLHWLIFDDADDAGDVYINEEEQLVNVLWCGRPDLRGYSQYRYRPFPPTLSKNLRDEI